ncbi:MAG: ribosome recycling factor [Firmicutes bacterium]|nr:ribosome recycling factor [Bacillota bacterium]
MNPQVKEEFTKFEARLTKAVDHYRDELLQVRAGRANPAVLNKIMVDYWGTMTPLSSMANITVPEPRMLVISLYDLSALKEVSKAITASDLGITPMDDGKVIRLAFPPLTEERRKEILKQLKASCENTKVVLRNERRSIMDTLKAFKKDNIITEDDIATNEKEVQKILDKFVEIADKLFKEKEVDILQV